MIARWLCIVMASFLLVAACAPKEAPLERPPEVVWEDFWAQSTNYDQEESFMMQVSVNFYTQEESRRFQASLWGNTDYPVRMDLSAGFGQTFAMWLEDGLQWQAYFPRENTQYVHHDGSQGATMLGYPTPLNLQETSMVLLGSFQDLLPKEYHHVESRDHKWEYHFENHRVQKAVLNQEGKLQKVVGEEWEVKFQDPEMDGEHFYFSKLEMQLSRDKQAVIRIKSLDLDRDWDEGQLALELPEDSRTVLLY